MSPLRVHMAYKSAKRLREIASVLVRHGFYPLMERLRLARLVSIPLRFAGKRRKDRLTEPVRARLAMEELGPTFIKFGQILSTRPDVVPHEYIIEFLRLQDSVSPLPFDEMRKVIEAEFGRPVEDVFSSIDEAPVAAASIAQVHRAITRDGGEVVVKVKRPGIEEVINTDIAILRYMARLALKYIPESRLYDPAGMVEEFSRVIRREMDFSLEASYMERFRENFSGDQRVKVPKVYWDLTGRGVLTMERVTGIKVDQVKRLKEEGIDTESIAHLIADIFFKQVFEFGLFHGDLHSGNIFVLSKDTIALVDFGIVGRIGPEMKQDLADILIGIATQDIESTVKVYQRMGILPEAIDKTAFEMEYHDIILQYFGRPLKHVKIGELLLDYIRLAARHEIRLPRELLLFDKCIIELEGLARVLYPDVNILEESEPYARRLFVERMSPKSIAESALSAASDYKDLAAEFPSQAGRLMKKVLDDRLRIEFLHKGLEDFMGEVDRSSNRLTFAVIIAALIIGSSLVIAAEAAPKLLGVPALGVLGFVIASVLGFWLAVQILRSGKF
ncbi:MAG: AarF/ABC1/UbiB kinase family protein [Thermodesulfobacteriota bacterium]|nr:MAG: AarF/ABC1/UbiB kinase family protein [Thermodesulfobacteriota bacterium]